MNPPATDQPAVPQALASSPAAGEPWWQRTVQRLADRANPVLVRIVRQDLRNKGFIGVFSVLLLAATIAAMVVGGFSRVGDEGDAANVFFGLLAWAWAFSLGLVQPLGSFRSVSTERNDDTWDLVELTGMRPRQVLSGLLSASLVQGMLYTSALAPFMVLAYLLRGLEMSNIVFVLVVVPLVGVAACSLGVFCACLGNNRASRALLGSLLGLGLAVLWCMSAGLFFNMDLMLREYYAAFRSSQLWPWIATGIALNSWLATVVVLLVFSGTLLTFRAANRSTAPRVVWYALWLNVLLWCIGGALLDGGDLAEDLADFLAGFAVFGGFWAWLLGLFSVSEDYDLSPRQARAITGGGRGRRAAMLVFGPGAARGRLSYLLLVVATLLAAGVALLLHDWSHARHSAVEGCTTVAWGTLCYGSILLLVADRLYRGTLAGWFPTAPLRRGFILLVTAIACLVPLLVLMLVDRLFGSALLEHSSLSAISPAAGVVNFARSPGEWAGTMLLVSLAGIGAMGALLMQGLRLGITTQRIAARDNDRNPRGG